MSIFYPVQLLADWLTYAVFSITQGTLFAGSVNFFLYDTVKIFILLCVIIFVVSYLRSYLPAERVRDIVAKRGRYVGHILAALLGVITPFCSCSAIPLFLGFVQAGIPLGVTFTFLVASPMVNEIALVLLFGLFGWKIALIYIASGLVIAILSGLVIGRSHPENFVEPFVLERSVVQRGMPAPMLTQRDRMVQAVKYTKDIVRKVFPYVILGVGVGAWIHGYVPADFLARYAGAGHWYAVPLAVLIGIPLYSNAAGIIPLVSALTEKGVAIGTVLAFMMAVTALSLPEFMILRNVMKMQLIALFAGIVGTGIIVTGYVFNAILR